ncbi:hypothetical protein Hanom_Chr03g00267531 [Helianthus anomalus]
MYKTRSVNRVGLMGWRVDRLYVGGLKCSTLTQNGPIILFGSKISTLTRPI